MNDTINTEVEKDLEIDAEDVSEDLDTNTDADDFQKNLMTMRAEVREVAILRQPAGFVDITVQ